MILYQYALSWSSQSRDLLSHLQLNTFSNPFTIYLKYNFEKIDYLHSFSISEATTWLIKFLPESVELYSFW